jgi:hypothetical protein
MLIRIGQRAEGSCCRRPHMGPTKDPHKYPINPRDPITEQRRQTHLYCLGSTAALVLNRATPRGLMISGKSRDNDTRNNIIRASSQPSPGHGPKATLISRHGVYCPCVCCVSLRLRACMPDQGMLLGHSRIPKETCSLRAHIRSYI